MYKELPKTIKDELIKLTKESQEAISSINWQLILQEISIKYILEEEFDDLQTEVALVLIGSEYPEFLAQNIKDNMGVSQDDSIKMANEIFEKIFTPIANELKEFVKNNTDFKNVSWDKSINFIISGGDYSVFLDKNDK